MDRLGRTHTCLQFRGRIEKMTDLGKCEPRIGTSSNTTPWGMVANLSEVMTRLALVTAKALAICHR